MRDAVARPRVNGIDLEALDRTLAAIAEMPSQALLQSRVHTTWTGQTRSETMVEDCRIGGTEVPRRFKIVADEPQELLGANSAPNAQELMLAALNACMVVGYVTQAAARGIHLSDCRIEAEGEFDLRDFGLGETMAPKSRHISCEVHLEGDCTREQFAEIHTAVSAAANRFFGASSSTSLTARLSST